MSVLAICCCVLLGVANAWEILTNMGLESVPLVCIS